MKSAKRLASKFTTVKDVSNPTAEELTAAGQAFNNKVQVINKDGSVNEELTNSNVSSVQNFVTSLSGDSNVWNQITSIDRVSSTGNGRQSDINFSVQNREEFFDALKQTTDQFGNRRFFYIGTELLRHEISARGVGYGASDPSMHIGRDGPTETNLGMHWENGSPITYPSASEYLKDQAFLARRAAAGAAHFGPRAKDRSSSSTYGSTRVETVALGASQNENLLRTQTTFRHVNRGANFILLRV